jgi:HSP20 family protein
MEKTMNVILRNRSSHPLPSTRLYAPFSGLVENLLEEFLTPQNSAAQSAGNFSPRIEVRENDQGYVVEADLPGVTKDNLKVSVEGQRIMIEAEVRRTSESKDGESIIHSERVVRKYTRSLELTHDVDDALTVAKLEHGVLTLNLPKKQASQSRLITIQ